MKTETRTYTLYQTTELSEESKEKGGAVSKLRHIPFFF